MRTVGAVGHSAGVEFREVVRRRRMVRDYDPDRPVPPELRERLLEHAIRAPSAGFSQGWAFLVLETPEERDRFWRASTSAEDAAADGRLAGAHAPRAAADRAAVAQAGLPGPLRRARQGRADKDEARWPVPYWDIDTGMAALLMLLTAVDEGLAACFFGIQPPQHPTFHAAFGVPDEYTAIGCVSVGYAGSDDRRSPSLRRGRRPVEEVVHRGSW